MPSSDIPEEVGVEIVSLINEASLIDDAIDLTTRAVNNHHHPIVRDIDKKKDFLLSGWKKITSFDGNAEQYRDLFDLLKKDIVSYVKEILIAGHAGLLREVDSLYSKMILLDRKIGEDNPELKTALANPNLFHLKRENLLNKFSHLSSSLDSDHVSLKEFVEQTSFLFEEIEQLRSEISKAAKEYGKTDREITRNSFARKGIFLAKISIILAVSGVCVSLFLNWEKFLAYFGSP